jgi:hypothetical protein
MKKYRLIKKHHFLGNDTFFLSPIVIFIYCTWRLLLSTDDDH